MAKKIQHAEYGNYKIKMKSLLKINYRTMPKWRRELSKKGKQNSIVDGPVKVRRVQIMLMDPGQQTEPGQPIVATSNLRGKENDTHRAEDRREKKTGYSQSHTRSTLEGNPPEHEMAGNSGPRKRTATAGTQTRAL
ncbi:hypothetical protein QAD02_002972 [Eretmocerus hayati]|uniref:Uncharacterized protein n=1 Tax=Eretmocerus hayati TaxID=131215 RepID=A0ACC2NLF3_9HYME|nr:hypothetical protein QAD02_002972 [Eretmocerus hayati]